MRAARRLRGMGWGRVGGWVGERVGERVGGWVGESKASLEPSTLV